MSLNSDLSDFHDYISFFSVPDIKGFMTSICITNGNINMLTWVRWYLQGFVTVKVLPSLINKYLLGKHLGLGTFLVSP